MPTLHLSGAFLFMQIFLRVQLSIADTNRTQEIPSELNMPADDELVITRWLDGRNWDEPLNATTVSPVSEYLHAKASTLRAHISAFFAMEVKKLIEAIEEGISYNKTRLKEMLEQISAEESVILMRLQARKMIQPAKLDCSAHINNSFARLALFAHNINEGTGMQVDFMPYLMACLKANPVDPEELPRGVGDLVTDIEITYIYGLEGLLELNNDGDVEGIIVFGFWWLDKRRTWDADILPKSAALLPNSIWHPKLNIHRCIDEEKYCSVKPSPDNKIYLANEGEASYFTSKKFYAECELQLENFPFDTQACVVYFIADPEQQFLNRTRWEFGKFKNDEWYIIDYFVETTTMGVSSSRMDVARPIQVPTLQLTINVRREPEFYIQLLIIPILLIALIGFFTIFLPANTSDKMNLAIAVVLAKIYLQSVIAELLPRTNEWPIISKYLISSLLVTAYNVIGSAIILGVHNIEHPRKPPFIVQVIFIEIMGLLMLFNVRKNSVRVFGYLAYIRSRVSKKAHAKDNSSLTEHNIELLPNQPTSHDVAGRGAANLRTSEISAAIERQELGFSVKTDAAKKKKKKLKAKEKKLWPQLAKVLNRFLSLSYLIGVTFVSCRYLVPLLSHMDSEF